MIKIIAIRHGETDCNKEDRLQGSRGPDLPLNDAGRKVILALRDSLFIKPEVMYVSPSMRTRETAEMLNEHFRIPLVIAPLLIERDFGTLSGKLRSTINPQILEDDLEGHYDYRPFGGESIEDVTLRIQTFIAALSTRNEEVVMLITHRGVIRILYDCYPDNTAPENIVHGSKHVFTIPDDF